MYRVVLASALALSLAAPAIAQTTASPAQPVVATPGVSTTTMPPAAVAETAKPPAADSVKPEAATGGKVSKIKHSAKIKQHHKKQDADARLVAPATEPAAQK
jgi:hypothetical protein